MAAKFYKKIEPNSPVILSTGQKIAFKTADYRSGYFSTDIEWLQQQLQTLIQNQQFGLSEIPYTEFDSEYLKKKNNALLSRKVWREEIGNTGIRSNPMHDLLLGDPVVATKPTPSACPAGFTVEEIPPQPKAPAIDAGAATTDDKFNVSLGKRI